VPDAGLRERRPMDDPSRPEIRGVKTWARAAAVAELKPALDVPDEVACCVARGLPLAPLNVKDFEDHVEHDGPVLVGE
jgi:hypothetical protein